MHHDKVDKGCRGLNIAWSDGFACSEAVPNRCLTAATALMMAMPYLLKLLPCLSQFMQGNVLNNVCCILDRCEQLRSFLVESSTSCCMGP